MSFLTPPPKKKKEHTLPYKNEAFIVFTYINTEYFRAYLNHRRDFQTDRVYCLIQMHISTSQYF